MTKDYKWGKKILFWAFCSASVGHVAKLILHCRRVLPNSWLEHIWYPDSFFKNAKEVKFHEMTIPNHYLWLWKDKTILYMVK